jgi:hypothetical protein
VLAEASKEGWRWYRSPRTGKKLPSVTTILGQISEYYIDKWRAGQIIDAILEQMTSGTWDQNVATMGPAKARATLEKEVERYLGRAASRGGAVHSWIEIDAARECGYDVEYPELTAVHRPFIDAYRSWRSGHQVRWLALECSVINDTVGYGGTADAVAEVDGVVAFLDYKTSKKLKTRVGAQLRALAKAEYAVGGDGLLYPVPPVQDHIAVLLCPDGSHLAQSIDDIDAAYDYFLGLLRAWDFERNAKLGHRFLRPHPELSNYKVT